MHQIHPQARTTPAVRVEIARSREATGVLAQRYGISDETVRKWRKRGVDECTDRTSRPRTLAWKATEEEQAIICHLRRATQFGLDDLTFVARHFLPHLNRDSIWRILKDAGRGCGSQRLRRRDRQRKRLLRYRDRQPDEGRR